MAYLQLLVFLICLGLNQIQSQQTKDERIAELEAEVAELRLTKKERCIKFGASYVFEPECTCVWIPEGSKSWDSANQYCEARNATLVVAKTAVALTNLFKTITRDLKKDIWVGTSDKETEGTWEWLSGADVSRSDLGWDGREPNNQGGKEDCGEINSKNKLNDAPCNINQGFACGIKLTDL